MKVSERLKVVDVIGTKVYKDGEQIIAQVQFLPSFSFSFIIDNSKMLFIDNAYFKALFFFLT